MLGALVQGGRVVDVVDRRVELIGRAAASRPGRAGLVARRDILAT